MKKNKISLLTEGAMIAAVYAVLTLFFWQFSSMQIQVRISEAMCILPLFTRSAIPGLAAGCFLINLIMGNLWDAFFGALATFLGAWITHFIGKKSKRGIAILGLIPPIVFNGLIIPLVLYFGYGITVFGEVSGMWAVLAMQGLSVAIGEAIACYGLGIPLYMFIKRSRIFK